MSADADSQDLAAEYVLGTLDAAERAEAELLIAEDAGFAASVANWEHRLVELSAMVAPVHAPAELWVAIQERLAQAAGALAAAEPRPLVGSEVRAEAAAEAVPIANAGEAEESETPAAEAAMVDVAPTDAAPAEAVASETAEADIAAIMEPLAPANAEAAAVDFPEPGAVETEFAIAEPTESAAAAAETSEPINAEPEVREAEVALPEPSEPAEAEAAAPESVEPPATLFDQSEPAEAAPQAIGAEQADEGTMPPALLDLDAAFRQTAERIAALSDAVRTESAEAAPAEHGTAESEAVPAHLAEQSDEDRNSGSDGASEALSEARGDIPVVTAAAAVPDAADATAITGDATEDAAAPSKMLDHDTDHDGVAATDLSRRMRRWRVAAAVFGAFAAGLVALILVAARAPHYLPEALRPQPEVRTVEVPREVIREVKVPTAEPGRFIAVLQTSAAAPAFIITADVAQRSLTVRRVAAETQAGHSYELWLISNRFQEPRSLGVIGASEFTHTATLAAYDPETIRDATFSVALEPEGGSPTGQPTGPVLFSGKLVEAVPPAPAADKP